MAIVLIALVTSLSNLLQWIPAAYSQESSYYVAPDGNDGNNGSEASPWLTIQKAANTLTPGDTVYVRTGSMQRRLL